LSLGNVRRQSARFGSYCEATIYIGALQQPPDCIVFNIVFVAPIQARRPRVARSGSAIKTIRASANSLHVAAWAHIDRIDARASGRTASRKWPAAKESRTADLRSSGWQRRAAARL